jgi:hypothetical protein
MRRSSAAMSLGGLLSDTALDPAFGCSEEADWRTGPSSSSSSDHTTHQRGFPLRQLVEMMAVLLLSADTDLPHGDAMRVAAEWLGLEDDDVRATHSADRYGRTLLNWRRAANGKSFRSSESDAA